MIQSNKILKPLILLKPLKSMGFLSFLVSLLLFLFPNNLMRVDAEIDADYIGTLYNVQHVSQTTKVYVIGPTLTMAINAGRTIYQELNTPLNSDNPEDYLFMDDGYYLGTREYNPPIRYYYFANYFEPVLTGERLMYNDYESVTYAIHYLESEAEYFNISDINNAVLSYIRCIDTNYKSKMFLNWDYYEIVCGVCDSTFVNLEKQMDPGGMKINEFFAAFIQDRGTSPASAFYDATTYGVCDSSFLTMKKKMINPISLYSNHNIDLIHMFASLDGIFQDTGESTGNTPYNLLAKNTYRHLVSWAGDLQESTLTCSQDEYLAPSLSIILASSHYGFSYDDYYADLDATNIAMNQSLNDIEALSSLFFQYYEDLLDEAINRETEFVSKIASTCSNTALSTNAKFESMVREMLGVDFNGNNIVNPLVVPSHLVKYCILSTDNNVVLGLAGLEYRNNMVERLLDYVLD